MMSTLHTNVCNNTKRETHGVWTQIITHVFLQTHISKLSKFCRQNQNQNDSFAI